MIIKKFPNTCRCITRGIIWCTAYFCLLSGIASCAPSKELVRLTGPELMVTAQRPRPDRDLRQLIPKDVHAVAFAKNKEIFDTPLGALIQQGISYAPSGQLSKALVREMMHNSTQLLWAARIDDAPQFLVLLQGHFEPKHLISRLTRQFKWKRIPAATLPAVQNAGVKAVAITENTLAIGTADLMGQCIHRLAQRGPSLVDHPVFNQVTNIRANSARAIYSRPENGASKDLLRQIPLMGVNLSNDIRRADAQLKLNQRSLQISASFYASNAKKQQELEKLLKKEQHDFFTNTMVKFLNIQWLKKNIGIASKGNATTINIRLSKSQLSRLNKTVDPLIKILQMMAEFNQ